MNRLKGVDDSSDDEKVADDQSVAPQHDGEQHAADQDLHDQSADNRHSDEDGPVSSSEEGDDADSSEEESEEDEEEIAKVREGFIVDSNSEEESSGSEDSSSSKKRRRKRRRRRHSEDKPIQLDEDDLDLLGETQGGADRGGRPGSSASGGRFKRLKRATQVESERKSRGLDAIFDDNIAEDRDQDEDGGRRRRDAGEFDDFIEADEFSEDDEDELRRQEEREIGRRSATSAGGRRGRGAGSSVDRGSGISSTLSQLTGIDEEKLSEVYDVFGNGEHYEWALANEEEEGASGLRPRAGQGSGSGATGELQLEDVFEPSELSAHMLTAEDNAIRSEDLPERYQLLRKRLQQSYDLNEEEFNEKKEWIANAVVEFKNPDPDFLQQTIDAVKQVVDFVSRENLEVPFIWHHRQDYLVHFSSRESDAVKTQLLTLDDLWHILDFDMDFHAIIERRAAASKLTSVAKSNSAENTEGSEEVNDSELSKLMSEAKTGTEFQDIIEYIQFTASAQLRAARRHSRFASFERVRNGPTMELVKAFNVDPVSVYRCIVEDDKIKHEDPAMSPTDMQETLGVSANVRDAIKYCSHALFFYPQLRKYFRSAFERHAKVDLILTQDGRRKITQISPFADLKYSYNWSLSELRKRPELFLRMLSAESQGLLVVRAQFPSYKTTLYQHFENIIAESGEGEWQEMRREIAKEASRLIVPMVVRNVLESLRLYAVRSLRYEVRSAFAEKLDQAPFKPSGYVLGTVPRVMCVTAGEANYMDAVLAVIVDEDGHVSEVTKLGDARNQEFPTKLRDVVKDVRPDVVAMAGFTASARRLFERVKQIINDESGGEDSRLMTGPEEAREPLQVIWAQDEVARLYFHSEKVAQEFPGLVPNARYGIGVARYVQNPLLEYAQLSQDQLRNLLIHKHQSLLAPEDFDYATETAFVDAVCLEGVNLNLAVRNQYFAAALRFVAGLGPRKASGIIKSVLSRTRGGRVTLRTQLVTAEITPRIVFMNCASFLRIPWSQSRESLDDEAGDYLDATRIHPEDYELARKMCADALELDEEDIEAVEDRTPGGVVGQLVSEDVDGHKLEELVLEEYAEELDQLFKQKKRVTLINIRNEIVEPYGEKRRPLHMLTPVEVFTMLTGLTKETLHAGSVVSAVVRYVKGGRLMLTLSGGVDGVAESGNISDDRSVSLAEQFASGQNVQAVVENVDYATLYAHVSTKKSSVQLAIEADKRRLEMELHSDEEHWNFRAEKRDADALKRKEMEQQRHMRIVKHPLFRPFNRQDAEAFLAPLQRGDLVIRPSSRGMDHLVVTWKVADQIYQHIDVLELDKPNEYALGKTLCVGNFRYNDLDELIIMHVQSMAHMVDEMTNCEKFQQGNRRDVEKWLSAYTNARPTQSVYAFCFDHQKAGYFWLCYMLGANQPMEQLHVRVLPNGFEFMKTAFHNVQSLINGFKSMAHRLK